MATQYAADTGPLVVFVLVVHHIDADYVKGELQLQLCD